MEKSEATRPGPEQSNGRIPWQATWGLHQIFSRFSCLGFALFFFGLLPGISSAANTPIANECEFALIANKVPFEALRLKKSNEIWQRLKEGLPEKDLKAWQELVERRFEYLRAVYPQSKKQSRILAEVIERARIGQSGAIGELEVLERALITGRDVKFIEYRYGVHNPDFLIDGKVVEVKTRINRLTRSYFWNILDGANEQLALSERIDMEEPFRGVIVLELRNDRFKKKKMSFSDVENIISTKLIFLSHASEVQVYLEGELIMEIVKAPSGAIYILHPEPQEDYEYFTSLRAS